MRMKCGDRNGQPHTSFNIADHETTTDCSVPVCKAIYRMSIT
jgi:hypothetical protein